MPYATNQGVCLYYEVIGQGPPIVLVHADFSSLEDWREFGVAGLALGWPGLLRTGSTR
jgi:pimeloyl-ACP methyl ester carboxylesterase